MKNKLRNICVITTQRSGSTWLIGLLNQHEKMQAYTEIYRPPKKKINVRPIKIKESYFQYRERKTGLEFLKSFQYLKEVKTHAPAEGVLAFKAMYDNFFRHPEVLLWIVMSNFSIVHLKRENIFENSISRELQKHLDQKHYYDEVKMPQITVDIDIIVKSMRTLRRHMRVASAILRILPVHVKTISYEQLKNDPETIVSSIHEFAGLDKYTIDMDSSIKKVVNQKYSEFIINYQELEAEIIKQGMGKYLPSE